jgi:glucose/mannose-6-phosphate isomerase
MSTLDKSNLRNVILEYPNQLKLGQKFAEDIHLPKENFSNLIICGMGGSALPGDLLSGYLQVASNFSLPVYVSRGYHLPKNADQSSLIFISSYSGNTEETISCLEEAILLGSKNVSFCAGGKLEQISKENHIPVVKYSIAFANFQPRFAATYAFAAMHQVLTNIGLCSKIEKFPAIDSLSLENSGQALAKKIKNHTPVIYASDKFKALAKNWKIKINENAKTPAFWNYFPELNHNEMVGFTNPINDFYVIFLKSENDQPEVKKRMDITRDLYQRKNLPCYEIILKGESYLEEFLFGLSFGDWVSYYLALEYGQDPTPVDMVEDFKKML